jgi:hypothetical protein
MNQNSVRPTLEEFLATCREALGYLKGYGFSEVTPPSDRGRNPYSIWFRAGDRMVIVEGEGWGEIASITLEHKKGLELSEIFLVPKERRPKPMRKRGKENTQLKQVREAATRLREFGVDFLEGNVERFLQYAKPLPPYKRSVKNG